nr:2-oxoglutarate-fe(ii) type oxidoreductase [Quercus suber]
MWALGKGDFLIFLSATGEVKDSIGRRASNSKYRLKKVLTPRQAQFVLVVGFLPANYCLVLHYTLSYRIEAEHFRNRPAPSHTVQYRIFMFVRTRPGPLPYEIGFSDLKTEALKPLCQRSIMAYTATQIEARSTAQQYLNSRLVNGISFPKSPDQADEFSIPEINISKSFSSNPEDHKTIARQIHSACTNSGFFHITGHGISDETRQSVLQLAKRFFTSLSPAQKAAIHVKHSKYFRGWEPADHTYVNPDDWDAEDAIPETKEAFNWGYESGLDPSGGDGLYRELDGEAVNGNVWPLESDIPGFYSIIKQYYGEILTLARHLFRLFALSLDLSEDHFDGMMTHPGGIARLLYYPAPNTPQALVHGQKDTELGLGAHSDYECFTILLCSSTSGLEILSPDNVWHSAPAVEGAFIINVADFLMRWTNGVYKSTVHRVVNRTAGAERYSVPFFFSVNYDEIVEVSLFGCSFHFFNRPRSRPLSHPGVAHLSSTDQRVQTLPSCVSEENPSKYPPIKAGEYILERLRATAKDE